MKRVFLFFGLLFFVQTLVFGQDTLPVPSSYRVNKVSFNMVRVEKGGFWMGAQKLDTAEFNYDRLSQSDEMPVHYVTMHEDYYIGQTEVTQKLWKEVMGYNPSAKKCPKRPVTNVNYFEVQEFLRRIDSITGMQFRLPTEEEWEYAARGGKYSKGYVYSGSNNVNRVAWHKENASRLKKVKKRAANELGIYDMSGNVWEWCSSKYHYFDKERNASLGKDGQMYVIRGGGWQLPPTSCRVSWRGKRLPDLKNSFGGFRLCLDARYVKEKEEAPEKEIKMKEEE
ncbi:MAG: formylglycine-generating enzyme family protein [Bacteroidales bacterium]|nr:formylglycine-generating enzyme family protein [Bacteroidales bacterium]